MKVTPSTSLRMFHKYSQLPKQPVVEASETRDHGAQGYKQSMPDYEDFDQSISW